MASQAPSFWWTKPDWRARLLWPVSFIYGRIAGRRMARTERASVGVPVICIGNYTVGGAGKTPTSITMARAARAKGLKPGFLSRGYGGSLKRTTVVDPNVHDAAAVGDEPLLLAREALTVISPDRAEGARRLADAGVNLIIMDDGFQSARLAIDYALLVIDSVRGIGNGRIFPSGPVRAPLALQMRQTSGLLKVGNGNAADPIVRQAARSGKPFMTASLQVKEQDGLAGRDVLAFAGIADPQKFFNTVESTGAHIAVRWPYGDHAHLSEASIVQILETATRHHLEIVTTSKDMVRLIGRQGKAEELLQRARIIEVEMAFADPRAPGLVIDGAIAACRERKARELRSNEKKKT